MRFDLIFQQSGDHIPFEVVYNHDLFLYFLEQVNSKSENSFYADPATVSDIGWAIKSVLDSIVQINPVLLELINKQFDLPNDELGFLNQDYLNRIHCEWVQTQNIIINIDHLRSRSRLGEQLHHAYPDEIRQIKLAEAFDKLGLLKEYEEINMGIHMLESKCGANHLSFDNVDKWKLFENPYIDQMITNNDNLNFNFGYTYLGRQLYDKWLNYDDELKYQDHYNYENLEFSFNVNLNKPQTMPFSKEFIKWCTEKNVKPVGRSIPIGNIKGLQQNLHEYRMILYRNIKANNKASIIIN